ncbi:hypothetical protein N7714_23910 [Pseudomonas aeruginosa]|uniref:hypothetical protein n=1 Tax=Pseudomonas aeruginosa TaxID=287 RepID=UPI00104687C1|nr:hypothetical protein [Pseudomonas aeruginosa]MDG9805533.1 hypothetical protein [Pseudomonas aeruginosa]MDG9907033.1 hypothetical protein [Pseudomonas aeruginosa]MDH0003519.1 hypothetical protein [Pseudomonas aeruginosa]MDH0011584.1 hypothetical protein [Pseudomonas aeruginosa]MDH0598779.1 hypothetical protein [Pseudomonas aeruginosa]
MSYCRWSSDDFQCDVYVYESVAGGFVTQVAANRVVFKEELPAQIPFEPEYVKEYLERHHKVMAMVGAADRVQIGLPHDGDSFDDADQEACADGLEYLKELGYRVPQYAIDALREESVEGSE